MTIDNYFNLVKEKIEFGDYKIKKHPDYKDVPEIKSSYVESIYVV